MDLLRAPRLSMATDRRGNRAILLAVSFCCLIFSAFGLVPPKVLCSSVYRSTSSARWKMYFDDVSRHTIRWQTSQSRQQPVQKLSPPRSEEQEAVQRLLLGYSAESASTLSSQEVASQMKLWATKSGIVGEFFGDELYPAVLGNTVCPAIHPVEAMAQFWAAVAALIQQHTDPFYPTRWIKMPPHDEGAVQFVTFPSCPDLYDYKTFFTFVTAMEFSKENCLHFGKRLIVSLFHPHFKNSPKLLCPERHSPFPAAGLQLTRSQRSFPPKEKDSKRQRGNFIAARETDGDDDLPLAQSRIRDIDQQRDILEVLFNSAAVSGSDQERLASIGDYFYETDPSLVRSFQTEQQLRRRRLPAPKVISICQKWVEKHRYMDGRGTKENRALRFVDTVEDRWTVSEHKIAEMVYADIWKAISQLYELGQEKEQLLCRDPSPTKPPPSTASAKLPTRFSQFDFVRSLSRSFQPSIRDERVPRQRPVVISSFFVVTKFCAFNAQSFKRYAITINAALKRLTGGRMFLEVFHTEYTGQSGFDNSLRRSPFPMIQICYEVKRK